MRFLAVLAAVAVLTPATAHAQADKKAVAPTTCAALVKSIGLFAVEADSTVEDLETGCKLTNVFIGAGSMTRYRIGEATLIAPELFTSYNNDSLPTEIDLSVKGLRLAPDTGSLMTDYMIEVQAQQLDVHLAYRWDKQKRTVDLADFSVAASDYDASFRVSGRFSDAEMDPDQFFDLTRLPGAMEELIVEVIDARFLSSMTVPFILNSLPYDEDPRPLIDGYKKSAVAFIAALPDDNVPGDAKAALTSFVEAFPKMVGDYTLTVRADPPLEFSALAIDGPADIPALLSRLQIAADHTPPKLP
ncbi:hypothetical protein [Devosia sp. 2618]|uniref:hypothetical protein n=1 Tax=Devosia sp. 2618 TaxID=3156454 RepID=UPI003397824E